MSVVIKVENLSKQYRLGVLSRKTLTHDLQSWWARKRGKDDPNAKLHQLTVAQRNGEERIWALKDVSFEVKEGEVLGIIGKNGAGKSTLLKILSRVTAPTSGYVKVKGRVASLLEVGTGFHPELTGRENIYLNGAILGMKRGEIAQKFDEIVDFAGVELFIDTPVKRYSSGMHVRLAFSVAAHLEPEILVVDEVLAVGDAEFQKKCLGKMGDVAKEGRTVLFVSHNMPSLGFLCQRALLLNRGEKVLEGDVDFVIGVYLKNASVHSDSITTISSEGHSGPRLVRACMIDQQGKPVTNINVGSAFGLQAEFESPYPIQNPVLGIRINNSLGITVIGINNLMQFRGVLCESSAKGTFRVLFPNSFLNQGDYEVTLMLSDITTGYQRLPSILRFTINPTDIFGTGKIPSPDQSLIIVPSTWEFYLPSEQVWEQ